MSSVARARLALITEGQTLPTELDRSPGFQVTGISDPEQALRLVEQGSFEAVALRLPLSEALPLTTRFRKAAPGVIVLLLLSEGGADTRRKALRAGANAVIRSVDDVEAQVGLLESAYNTVRLATINHRLSQEVQETSMALDAAVRQTREARFNGARRRGEAAAAAQPASRKLRALLVGGGRRKRDEIALAVTESGCGWTLESASDPAEAARGPLPDLILLGSDPMSLSCDELLSRLRKEAGGRQVPVLALLDPAENTPVAAAYHAGVSSCVLWPPNDADRIALIRAADAYWALHLREPANP